MTDTKTKHTPGPWKCIGGKTAGDWSVETGDWSRVISTVRGSGRSEFANTEEANARLIAAAPELLEMLKGIQAFVSSAQFHDQAARLRVWERVDAAIAKAEGK